MPEPLPVRRPSPAIPRVKIFGNITELKNPTRMMLHMAKCAVLSTDVITRVKDATAAAPSTVPERSFCSKGTDKPADHSAAPVERNKTSCNFFGYVANVRLAEVVDEEAPDRDFRADINENSDCPEHQIAGISRRSRALIVQLHGDPPKR